MEQVTKELKIQANDLQQKLRRKQSNIEALTARIKTLQDARKEDQNEKENNVRRLKERLGRADRDCAALRDKVNTMKTESSEHVVTTEQTVAALEALKRELKIAVDSLVERVTALTFADTQIHEHEAMDGLLFPSNDPTYAANVLHEARALTAHFFGSDHLLRDALQSPAGTVNSDVKVTASVIETLRHGLKRRCQLLLNSKRPGARSGESFKTLLNEIVTAIVISEHASSPRGVLCKE